MAPPKPRDFISIYLEERVLDVWEAKNADVNNFLLMVLRFGKDGFKAVDRGASLSHNPAENVDVEFGALEDIFVLNELPEPIFDLCMVSAFYAPDIFGCRND